MELFLFLFMKLLEGVRALLGLVLAGVNKLILLIDARLQLINDGPAGDAEEEMSVFINTPEKPDWDEKEKAQEALRRGEPDEPEDLDDLVQKALLNKPL